MNDIGDILIFLGAAFIGGIAGIYVTDFIFDLLGL